MKLRITARCIILDNGSLLVQVSRRGDFYKLPGGKIKPAEPIMKSLEREIYEELGLRLQGSPKLVGVVDSFYRDKSSIVHEVGFYFLCSVEGVPTPRENHIEVKWVRLDDSEINRLKPAPVREIIEQVVRGNIERVYYISVEL